MTEDSPAKRFIEPIDLASRPAFIAGLNLSVAVLLGTTTFLDRVLRAILGTAGMMFLLSSLAVFFFSVYPTRHKLWIFAAITFLVGLLATIVATGIAVTVVFG